MIENTNENKEEILSCDTSEMDEANKQAEELVKVRTEQYKKFQELLKENNDGETNID